MLCKAITKDSSAKFLGTPAHTCQWSAWKDGFCRIHHPAFLLPKLRSREARLLGQLDEVRRRIESLQS